MARDTVKINVRKLFTKKFLWIVLGIVTSLVLFTCLPTQPPILKPPHPPMGNDTPVDVHVLSHGWHTGIAVRAEDLNARIPMLAARFPACKYLEIGWGDAGFYQAKKITLGITMRAVFLPTPTVVHIVGFNDHPNSYFNGSEYVKITISHDNFTVLLDFIQSSFAKGADGEPIPESQGIYGDSQFYTGAGSYYAYNTCNKWTAKALKSGGVEISPHLKLTSKSVMGVLAKIARKGRRRASLTCTSNLPIAKEKESQAEEHNEIH